MTKGLRRPTKAITTVDRGATEHTDRGVESVIARLRAFGLSRVRLREYAHAGYLPGVTKSSW